jgi:hypothetical protein
VTRRSEGVGPKRRGVGLAALAPAECLAVADVKTHGKIRVPRHKMAVIRVTIMPYSRGITPPRECTVDLR